MNNLDEMIAAMRSAIEQIGPPVTDSIRLHPDDYREMVSLSRPVSGGSHWPMSGGFQAFYLEGLPVYVDEKAERLPRK